MSASTQPVEPSLASVPAQFPAGVRLAQPGDEAGLLELFLLAHHENGWGGVDVQHVRRVIGMATGQNEEGVVVGVIAGPERVEAALGLTLTKQWYGTDADWFWTEMLVYVHPEHRRSRHAVRLMRFAQWWGAESGKPVVISSSPVEGAAAKARFFSRFGAVCSVSFLVSGKFSPGGGRA